MQLDPPAGAAVDARPARALNGTAAPGDNAAGGRQTGIRFVWGDAMTAATKRRCGIEDPAPNPNAGRGDAPAQDESPGPDVGAIGDDDSGDYATPRPEPREPEDDAPMADDAPPAVDPATQPTRRSHRRTNLLPNLPSGFTVGHMKFGPDNAEVDVVRV